MPPRRLQPRVADAMTPGEFIAKWRASQLKESAASQEHFIDLCRLLGEPTPAEADPTGERYCFERGARKDTLTGSIHISVGFRSLPERTPYPLMRFSSRSTACACSSS